MPVELIQERDFFDWAVGAFTIVTGLVLAMAGAVALTLQRARYFRDIAPDLRVVRHVSFGSLDHKTADGKLAATVAVGFKNISEHEAYDLKVRVATRFLWNTPSRLSSPSPTPIFTETTLDVEGGSPKHAPLLPGDEADFRWPVFLGRVETGMDAKERASSISSDLDSRPFVGVTTLELEFSTKRELILWFLNPFGGGRLTFRREESSVWEWKSFPSGEITEKTYFQALGAERSRANGYQSSASMTTRARVGL